MSTDLEIKEDMDVDEESDDESSSVEESDSEEKNQNIDEESMKFTEVDEETLRNLEKQVEDNPYNYQAHLNLIETLRTAGELEKLRECRQRFASTYPLTPKLWSEWINDERRIEAPWDEIRALFEKAVQDYLSVQLWLEYVQVACGHLAPPILRELCERALSQVGLHVADGRLLWDAYRIFESALAGADPDLNEKESAATDHLLQLFKRQLSIPLMGMDETKEEFLQLFGEEKFDATVQQAYNAASEELRALNIYEAELNSTERSLDSYLRYLDYEECITTPSTASGSNDKDKPKEKRTPNIGRLRCLYERAITDQCLNVDLWLRYVQWLDKRFSSANSIIDSVLPVYERAVRNCTWSTVLWTKYALAIERSGVENWSERADAIFRRAFKDGGYASDTDARELWLAWSYQKRRAADAGLCTYEVVDETFEKGAEFLKEKFGDRSWDSSTLYRRSWSSFLAFPRKRDTDGVNSTPNMPKARAIWKDILASDGNGRLASVWLDYFHQIERRCGDAKEARKTLYNALNSVTDFPDYVAVTLRQFELEEGTLKDLDDAEERIRRQAARLRERKLQQHSLTSAKYQPAISKKEKPTTRDPSNAKSVKRKLPVDDHQPSSQKKPKLVEPKLEPTSSPAPAPASSVVTAQDPAKRPSDLDPDTRRRTIFVSNLDFKLNEDRLKEVFESQNIGKVVDIRLTRLRPDRTKGYGYVEFDTLESAQKALTIDRHPIDGRPMYVSEYKDRAGGGASSTTTIAEKAAGISAKSVAAEKYHFNAGLEKNKLFVKNIPKHATDADLKAIFEPHGNLKSIRLVTFPSGQSKGMAYIEYGNEESASNALSKTEGTFLFGQPLSVAISNPPPRRPGFGQSNFQRPFQRQPPNGSQQQDKDSMPPPAPRMLMPRSVAAPNANKPTTTGRKPKLVL